jgi:putative ABC transport system permease protein
MKLTENLAVGLGGLIDHKLRTLLTMLGIIFGVAAVVAMLSIGEGARREALKKYEMLGVNNIIVREKPMNQDELQRVRAAFSRGLSISDAESLSEIVPFVEVAAPQREIELDVKYLDVNTSRMVVGTVISYQQLINYYVEKGSFFNRAQYKQREKVCVLGAGVKRKLFPLENALDKMIKLGDQWFRVIGVMERKGQYLEASGVAAIRDLDQDIYIPLSTSTERLEMAATSTARMTRRGSESSYERTTLSSEIDQITIRIGQSEDLPEAANLIKRILLRRHHNNMDFEVIVPEALLAQEQKEKRIFDIVMACIAGISLLVGGIGIMNIMLATVLERTREIGVRRAIGATRSDILGQFVVEASLLSFIGGAIGILIGFAMAFAIDQVANFRAVVTLSSIVVAFGVSTLVGLVFGIYPARKAAQLDPIEALRYE